MSTYIETAIEKFKAKLEENLTDEKQRWGQTVGDRISWLMKCYTGSCFQFFNGGPWREGLDANDGYEHSHWQFFFRGVAAVGGFDPQEVFQPYFDDYVARVEAEYDAQLETEEVPE